MRSPPRRSSPDATLRLAAALLLGACAPAETPPASTPPADTPRPDSSPAVIACSADARPAIVVTARDAGTRAPLGAFTVVLRPDSAGAQPALDSGTIAEDARTWGGAAERAGRYRVAVSRAGYQPWDTTGIVVARDACHVLTVRVEAALRPVR